MPDQDPLRNALNEIRVSDAVVVLGAGASFLAGMPLADQLTPLVWHTLDAHPGVLQQVRTKLACSTGTAKEIIGDDLNRRTVAFAQIAADDDARRTFQSAFASLNLDRADHESAVHVALARLLHSGRVLRVVSLNWDTLLEAAFARRYGIDINGQGTRLWKPHGDCSRPIDRWVLPGEGGVIPDEVVNDLSALARERPRTLLIVGYSERDDVVIERLIRPLATKWRVFRLSPNAVGEGAIGLPVVDALRDMADILCPEPDVPGWEFVTFSNPRGIEGAVAGERLGPQDVDACPRLPHFSSAQLNLELLHMAEIAGQSGCGKSITAWQLAREYSRQSWEVLRPAQARLADGNALIEAVRFAPWKRVVVVDDTQTFPAHFASGLMERAGPNLKVILGTTDAEGERSASIRIPAKIAVETLAKEFRRRRDEVLPIVHRYDARVGDAYMSDPIERRIDDAEKSDTPWQFAFVLRGGWSQVREQLNALRDFDRADLLLVMVAARQLLSLDAGTDIASLLDDAVVLGRSDAWVRLGLDRLRQRRVIFPGEPLRCIHLQAAATVIESALKDRRDNAFSSVVAALRRLVSAPSSSIRGIHWLLERVLGADAFRYRGDKDEDRFFSSASLEELLGRMLSSAEPIARRDSAFLLSRLLWYRELDEGRLIAALSTFSTWADSATSEDAYAIGDLLNSVCYGSKVAGQRLVQPVEPDKMWARVAAARPAEGYAWGHYLNRLAAAGGAEWRTRAKRSLPRGALQRVISEFSANELDELAEFIQGIASFDRNVALDLIRRALPALRQGFADDALKAYLAVSNLQRWVLGHGLFDEKKPTRAQRELSRQVTDAIEPRQLTAGILTCRFGDWESYARLLVWIGLINRTKHRQIVAAFDWSELDRRASSFWQAPPREFRLLLANLTLDKRGQPVRRWLAERADRIQEIDPVLSGVSPEAAIAVFRRGGRVNLSGHNEHDWQTQAWAVARVAELDRASARRILESNQAHIAKRLSNLEAIDSDDFPFFLRLTKALDPSLARRICGSIELSSAAERWPRAIEDANGWRGARQVLRFVSRNGNGKVKKLATGLLACARAHRMPAKKKHSRRPVERPRHRRRAGG